MNTQLNDPGMAPGRFTLQTSGEILEAYFSYYGGLKKAKEEGKPVVWVFGCSPREILHAADATAVYLEHLPFILGLQGQGSHYMQIAEEHGFSKDTCGTHRCFLGCGFSKAEERDPFLNQNFAAPDLILVDNFPCMSESKSFLAMADHYKCPYYIIDTPINTWGAHPPGHALEYVKGQIEGAINFLAENGLNIDRDKLKEAVRLTKQSISLWRKINDLRKIPPTVMGSMDGLATAVLLMSVLPPGQAVALLKKAHNELKEKIDQKNSFVAEEKLRLMFWGVPPTYDMQLLDSVEKYGAVFSSSMIECATGGSCDPSYMDPDKPLKSIAHRMLVDVLNPLTDNMVKHVIQDLKDFSIDGLVLSVKRSCGLLPGFIRQIIDAAYKEVGVPAMIVEIDGMDHREYDYVAARANLDSFVETLIASKQ